MEYRVIRREMDEGELYHWGKNKSHKYIARVKDKRGKWRYFYTRDEYQAYLKDGEAGLETKKNKERNIDDKKRTSDRYNKKEAEDYVNKLSNKSIGSFTKSMVISGKNKVHNLLTGVRNIPKNIKLGMKKKRDEIANNTKRFIRKQASKIPEKINDGVTKFKKAAIKLQDDPNNIYDVTSKSYKKKVAKIKKTKEWKDIVKRKDPEYVRKDKDGKTVYLIDDYIAKKKNPIVDIVDDIVSNRKVTVNAITKDSTVAAVKEAAFRTIALGIFIAGAASKFMIEKSKLYQGSYDDEIKDLKKRAERGAEYVSKYTDDPPRIDQAEIDRVMEIINQSSKVAEEIKKPANQQKAEEALSMLMDTAPKVNYEDATSTLSDLTEEDIRYINEMLKKKKQRENRSV